MKSLSIRLAGGVGETDERGRPLYGDDLLLLVNAEDHDVTFVLPDTLEPEQWKLAFDTADKLEIGMRWNPKALLHLPDRSLIVLRCGRNKAHSTIDLLDVSER